MWFGGECSDICFESLQNNKKLNILCVRVFVVVILFTAQLEVNKYKPKLIIFLKFNVN